MSFWAAPRGPQSMITGALAALQGIMLLVLLAVCGNTANLMLARASTRQREVGVRVALGAGRARIVSVLLAENVLLALGGGLLGAALAAWGTNAIRAVPFIGSFPIRFQTHVDALGLAVATALALACGVLVGLAPALQLAGVEPQRALRNGSRTMSRNRLRSAADGRGSGARADRAARRRPVLPRSHRDARDRHRVPARRRAARRLRPDAGATRATARRATSPAACWTRLSAMPGIESAAIATQVPLDIHGLPLRSFAHRGACTPRRPARTGAEQTRHAAATSRRWAFRCVEGVDFADFAAPEDQAQVIVNEEFVRRFAAEGTALGRRVQNGDRTYRICGVVRTTLYESFDEDPTPIVYFSFRDRPASAGEIHVRTREGAEMADRRRPPARRPRGRSRRCRSTT